MRRVAVVVTAVLLMAAVSRAQAQLPIHLSLSGGLTAPMEDTGDLYNQGFHVAPRSRSS
jgi:hypothetical protein